MKAPEEQTQTPRTLQKESGASILLWIVGGGVVGLLFGTVAGGLLESLITGETYAGRQIGGFLGGMLGGQVAAGTGRFGIALISTMILCSTIGALIVPLTIGLPSDTWLSWNYLGAVVCAVTGAFLGLAMGCKLFGAWRIQQLPAA